MLSRSFSLEKSLDTTKGIGKRIWCSTLAFFSFFFFSSRIRRLDILRLRKKHRLSGFYGCFPPGILRTSCTEFARLLYLRASAIFDLQNEENGTGLSRVCPPRHQIERCGFHCTIFHCSCQSSVELRCLFALDRICP